MNISPWSKYRCACGLAVPTLREWAPRPSKSGTSGLAGSSAEPAATSDNWAIRGTASARMSGLRRGERAGFSFYGDRPRPTEVASLPGASAAIGGVPEAEPVAVAVFDVEFTAAVRLVAQPAGDLHALGLELDVEQ